MFTVGDVALLKAAKPPSGLVVLLQALTAHKFIQSSSTSAAAGYSQAGSQAVPDVAAGAEASQAAEGDAGVVDAAGGATQTQGGGGRLVPACVQAHAWIALGKVCLMDENLAKKCVPLFVQVRRATAAPVHCSVLRVCAHDPVSNLVRYCDWFACASVFCS
jgi:condensin-2 complex subunit D3